MNPTENANQRRGIMSNCNYIIQTIQTLKSELIDTTPEQQALRWGIAGIIISLTQAIVKISHHVIETSVKTNEGSSLEDIENIRKQFNEFVDVMINSRD